MNDQSFAKPIIENRIRAKKRIAGNHTCEKVGP